VPAPQGLFRRASAHYDRDNPKVDRLIVRIDPERVTGGESRQPWDVTS
jgi:hypothetical protein